MQAERVTRPTAEPIILAEAKKQLEIASTDSTHDGMLQAMISEAREQWEHDTDSAMCFQNWKVQASGLPNGLHLPKSPIQNIVSIQYYDGNNALQTLSSSLYQLFVNEIRYAYQATMPATASRWDAWQIVYRCGYSQDGTLVPAIAKRAMLLLVGYYFDSNRGDNDRVNDLRAYESLVAKFMRASYP
jgi:uncharacterized phiE125 gp8 family phage protein